MTLITKRVKGKDYYYSFLSYFLIDKSKGFSKYIGAKKPTAKELAEIETSFRRELIQKLANKDYSASSIGYDDVIKSLLFRDMFNKKYRSMTELKKRKYDIDSTVFFTLTTLTTEDIEVDLVDVRKAFDKHSHFTDKEQISKNMLKAVESIKRSRRLNIEYLLELHKMIMASFKTKTPGKIRDKQVYLYKHGQQVVTRTELSYRPPTHMKISKLLQEFLDWYTNSNLNPIEKAALSHYKLYRIHPFLDGNKRICRLILNKTLLDSGFPLLNISLEKEAYFEALIDSVEKNTPDILVDFTLKQYYRQVKEFLSN